MEIRQNRPEKALRFHAVILKNNATELARLMINNPSFGFLREAIEQANTGMTTGPGWEIQDMNPSPEHYRETLVLLEQAASMLDQAEPGTENRRAGFLLSNSAHHCIAIIGIIHEHPRATGKASIG